MRSFRFARVGMTARTAAVAVVVAVVATLILCAPVATALAQTPPVGASSRTSPRTAPRLSPQQLIARDSALSALDMWLTQRFKGAQLLPDSVKPTRATPLTTPPRIESVNVARTKDTLFAVQFMPQVAPPALAVGSTVRLSSPSGVMTNITAEIIVRRAFRAPRQPGAALTDSSNHRYGWSYIALIRRVASTPSTMYRGWVMVAVPPATKNARSP